MMDGWNMNGGWWWFGVICMVGLTALVVWGAIALSRALSRGGAPGAERDGWNARTVLDERYARGEIDEDEYRRRRHVLSG
jgi:putative membrane protein